MEHVTIISQEAITQGLLWPSIVVGSIAICFAVAAGIVSTVGMVKRCYVYDHCVNLIVHAICMIPILFLTMGICTICFPQETGRYRYEGTFDSNMTVVEFEEFQQKYDNVRFEDGVWKWEDKE